MGRRTYSEAEKGQERDGMGAQSPAQGAWQGLGLLSLYVGHGDCGGRVNRWRKLVGDIWVVRRVFRGQASVYGGRRRWLARRIVVVIELRSCSGAGQERETMRASQSVQYLLLPFLPFWG